MNPNTPASQPEAKFTPNRRNSVVLGILLAGLIWIWVSRIPPGSAQVNSALPFTGFLAPPFNLQTPTGEVISLETLRGQPVIVNLWASWCPPCKAEMPALETVYQEYRSQGLVILGVNTTNQDDPGAALDFAEEMGLSFPILFDLDGSVSRLYQLQALPTTYFIDERGIIREIVVGGPMSEALLRVRAEQLLED